MDQRRARLGLHGAQAPRARRPFGAQNRIVAPKRRTFSCFTFGAFSGITTHAGMPRRARRIGERGAVIARRMRDDAAPRLGVAQREHGVGRAARLERADLLQVLALEEELRAGLRVERRGSEITGVRCTCGAMRACAARIAARSGSASGPRVRRVRHQLPAAPWMFGKNRSFHESGLTLIAPTLAMKSTYFITFCGVVV